MTRQIVVWLRVIVWPVFPVVRNEIGLCARAKAKNQTGYWLPWLNDPTSFNNTREQ